MSKLQLPDVTLVCVETREHELARMALHDCMDAADFGDVLIVTNEPSAFTETYRPMLGEYAEESIVLSNGHKARWKEVPDWPDKLGWSRSWWFDVPPLLRTRQTLNIQWDSWICDASMWRDEFLDYDYIGAPWWYKDGLNVGNGGFSLVSSSLKRYVAKNRGEYPCTTHVDDDLLCRKYRPKLENVGFSWAPERVARRFAYEGCGPDQPPFEKHFGFHAMFNWPKVLTGDRLWERIELALKSPYINNPKSYILKSFCQMNPEIAAEMADRFSNKGAEHGSLSLPRKANA